MLNALLFNEQATASQMLSEQTKLSDIVLAPAPKGRVKSEYYQKRKRKLPWFQGNPWVWNTSCQCIDVCLDKGAPAVACTFLIVDLIRLHDIHTLILGVSKVMLVVKNLPAKSGDIRDTGSIPGPGRYPGGGDSNPLQYSCLKNPIEKPGGL